jgi:hypothetical protein
VIEKKGPAACDNRAVKAEFSNQYDHNSASAFQSQLLTDALRLRRLIRAGLTPVLAAATLPLIFGEARP